MAERTGKIWHVEDAENWRRTVSHTLTDAGHHVLSTSSFHEAFSLVPDGIRDRNVLIADMNLGKGDLERGDIIVALVKRSRLPIVCVGLASGVVPGVDLSLDKAGFDEAELLDIVDRALEMSDKLLRL